MPHLLSLPQFLASHAVEIKDAIMSSKNIEVLTCLQKKIIVADQEELIGLIGFLFSLDRTFIFAKTSTEAYMAVLTTIKARIMILSCSPGLCRKEILSALEKIAL